MMLGWVSANTMGRCTKAPWRGHRQGHPTSAAHWGCSTLCSVKLGSPPPPEATPTLTPVLSQVGVTSSPRGHPQPHTCAQPGPAVPVPCVCTLPKTLKQCVGPTPAVR